MDKRKAIEIAKRYKSLVQAQFPLKLKALYLFGSYSKGGFTPESDIDIAVVVEPYTEDHIETSSLLWKFGRMIDYLIEPVLLTENEDSPLYEDVIKTGILI